MTRFFWWLFGGEFRVLYHDGRITFPMTERTCKDYAKIFGGTVYPDYQFEYMDGQIRFKADDAKHS